MTKLVIGLVILGLLAIGWKVFSRTAYESAEYRLVKSDSEFEIREYPELVMATTNSVFSAQGKDGSFMRLFRYISGSNEKQQKIEMTTPVFMDSVGGSRTGEMSFVLPKQMASQSVPRPSDQAVEITRRPGGRYAVIRFSGYLNKKTATSAEKKLRKWMADHDLIAATQSESAGYDPPVTPGMFRRNEILIKIESKP